MKRNFLKLLFIEGATLLSLSSCNGIFDELYDDAPALDETNYGFINVDDDKHMGTIYVNSTAYDRWMYLDLHNQKLDSVLITDDMIEPESWDFAVHRYDTKTNGAEALETGSTGFDALLTVGMPNGTFEKDFWTEDKVSIDMSHMMEGYLVYAKTYYNAELSKWLNVSTATMPPTYTPSNKVYLLRMKDGTMAALKLSNYMDGAGNKGWLTIDYIYPIEF